MKRAFIILLFISTAFADVSSVDEVYHSVKYATGKRILSCRRMDPKKMEIGAQCVTTKGVIYELVRRTTAGKSVWKDMATGLLWSPSGPCLQDGPEGKFGSKKDLPKAEMNGIRQIIPNVSVAPENC